MTGVARFEGQQCVICPNPSVGVGEHVWPTWLLKEFEGEGPFRAEKSGAPILNRDGDVATHNALHGAHVPMCGECNSLLAKYIEEPVKDVIRAVMPKSTEHEWPTLTADDCEALARWFLKVGLLLSHSEVEYDDPRVNRDPDVPRMSVAPTYLQWMRDGSPPPTGFSVYIQRRSLTSDVEEWGGDTRYVLLPDAVNVGDSQLGFWGRSLGIRGLDVDIVWHPGWPLVHPLVEEGRAVELWPNATDVDFASLGPEVHPAEVQFSLSGVSVTFTPDQYQASRLPPLRDGLDLQHFATALESLRTFPAEPDFAGPTKDTS